MACLSTTLFFGGWQVPWLTPDGFHFPLGRAIAVCPTGSMFCLGVMSFSIKVLVFCFLFMQIRWTLPRFRYDQLMKLGWKGLFPIAVVNVVVTAVVLFFLGDALMAAKVKIVRRPELTFWEKLYHPADRQRPQDHLHAISSATSFSTSRNRVGRLQAHSCRGHHSVSRRS